MIFSIDGTVVETFPKNMIDLASSPLKYTVYLNGKAMKLEYGVGVSNPGLHLKCNGEFHKNMPSSRVPDTHMFQRGALTNNFESKLKKSTQFEIFAGPDLVPLVISAEFNVKN